LLKKKRKNFFRKFVKGKRVKKKPRKRKKK